MLIIHFSCDFRKYPICIDLYQVGQIVKLDFGFNYSFLMWLSETSDVGRFTPSN